MKRSDTRTQMGPGSGGNPYIDAIQFVDGWLEVNLRREVDLHPQHTHVICLFAGGDDHTIHKAVRLPTGTKRATARFKPLSTDSSLAFEPVVHVGGQPESRAAPEGPKLTPVWIKLRALSAANSKKEFDRVSVLIELDDDELIVTELDEENRLGADAHE